MDSHSKSRKIRALDDTLPTAGPKGSYHLTKILAESQSVSTASVWNGMSARPFMTGYSSAAATKPSSTMAVLPTEHQLTWDISSDSAPHINSRLLDTIEDSIIELYLDCPEQNPDLDASCCSYENFISGLPLFSSPKNSLILQSPNDASAPSLSRKRFGHCFSPPRSPPGDTQPPSTGLPGDMLATLCDLEEIAAKLEARKKHRYASPPTKKLELSLPPAITKASHSSEGMVEGMRAKRAWTLPPVQLTFPGDRPKRLNTSDKEKWKACDFERPSVPQNHHPCIYNTKNAPEFLAGGSTSLLAHPAHGYHSKPSSRPSSPRPRFFFPGLLRPTSPMLAKFSFLRPRM